MNEPTSMGEYMRDVAKYMDIADALYRDLAIEQGHPYRPGDEAQQDMRHLAEWFDLHPHISGSVHRFIFRREVP